MDKEKIGVKTPEYVSLQFQLAGLGSRATAFIIDYAILLISLIIISLSGFYLSVNLVETMDIGDAIFSTIIIFAFVFLVISGYFILFEAFGNGQTIGKRIMRIRVINENGNQITFIGSLLRNLFRIIDMLPGFYLVGLLMIFIHPRHKRVGDLVAGTIVVYERKHQFDGKQRKKLTPIEKEIAKRNIKKERYKLGEWELKSFQQKDWELLRTYSERFLAIPEKERQSFTEQLVHIMFPKAGWDTAHKTTYDLENDLLALYLILKGEWDYEL
ncbi:MAG TPA: RDD family protein [Cerasibacillus sp.]|uniref:RDD family protein n=1 Tax=Cerasibacillus sp. TaxID=2498711 RepID=UPI002F3E954A